VHTRRTKREYTQFCLALAAAYPQARKIRLVQDNLNTHNLSAFCEHLPAAEAFELAQRFKFHYTPKGGSWLNVIEVEFSAVARQCLDRHIPTQEQLPREVLRCIQERAEKKSQSSGSSRCNKPAASSAPITNECATPLWSLKVLDLGSTNPLL
jgi:hypothetical protein